MSKKCAVCGKPLESGVVVHSECVPRWIPVSEGLPKEDKKHKEYIRCFVTLVDMVDRFPLEDGELIRTATEALYDIKQKLWVFKEDYDGFTHDPLNALVGERAFIGEDGEWLDVGSFVTHWMPLPEPPEVE